MDEVVDENRPGFGVIFQSFKQVGRDDFVEPQDIEFFCLQIYIVNGIVHLGEGVRNIVMAESVGTKQSQLLFLLFFVVDVAYQQQDFFTFDSGDLGAVISVVVQFFIFIPYA